MFDVGIPELILVLVVALVVFGPGKLPEIGSSLGKAIGDFRRATQGINDEIKSVTDSVTNLNLEAEDEATTRRIMAEKAAQAEPVVPPPTITAQPVDAMAATPVETQS